MVNDTEAHLFYRKCFMEWTFLGLVAGVFMVIIWQACVDIRKRKAMTETEWEQRERQGVSLLGASGMALQQILQADMRKAAAAQEDARQNRLPGATQENNRQRDKGGLVV